MVWPIVSPHPVTDKVLEAQRKVLSDMLSADMPIKTQRRISRELLWHAMFMVANLDPDGDMRSLATLSQSAIIEGIKQSKV